MFGTHLSVPHRAQPRTRAHRQAPDAPLESGEELELRDERPDPEQSLSVEQQRQRLFDAILKLPVGYRQVVTLALEGMSYAEIGDVLGIAESNAGARLTRARQMLRTWLKGTSHGT